MNRRHLITCVIALVVTLALTAYVYAQLPEVVPIHWNLKGEIDAYGPRWHVWLSGPLLIVAILGLRGLLPWLSPKGFSIEAFAATFDHLITILVIVFASIQVTVLAAVWHGDLDIGRMLMGITFMSLILIGNPMGKVRRNFFVGIRTPWTLASEKVWYATHRLGGKVLVGTGLAGLLAVLADVGQALLLALLVIMPLWPVIYSLLLYKRLERAGEL
ncbi:SdpI family protein [Pseudoduganella plicata]|uniref:SdpI family protein n=1 Tax=Pseudoduganella plicata TaxID=321984 RepID=A0A4P7BDV4_9BURK|nr:SdpI family protein [Pseudoduganella plicata]QBQ36127.1 SdpI family protein [Pseudoduganella plicata]GGY77880.1 hypothetical protein GCM10007388_08380 [Pseudoduganella plicata]